MTWTWAGYIAALFLLAIGSALVIGAVILADIEGDTERERGN